MVRKSDLKFFLTRSQRASLTFSVGLVYRMMKEGNYMSRISSGAPIYLTAVLEYLTAEILKLAGNAARDSKEALISPRHLKIAIRNDHELNRLLTGITISQASSLSYIEHNYVAKTIFLNNVNLCRKHI
ncbi:hypothetical protein ACKWTF_013443 [Chironomus riparius]